jgi:hypothetical protein
MLKAIRAFHPSTTMPPSPTEVEGYYLSCFNQKRSVLLLDDAGSKEQVRPALLSCGCSSPRMCLTCVARARVCGADFRCCRCFRNRRVW